MEPYITATNGVILVFLLILTLILLFCLILAPLFIWKWTKATKREITRLNSNTIALITMLKRWENRYLLVDGEQSPDHKDERLFK
ncbi:hypothetical protein LF599_09920 [Pseudodesulfovibrio thermohalotolerans]|uniref:hypothetical protein n=1 Tax=Pseudodesulfovibrio thermohalotolerans TaxID=2880651 RepID=UPI0024419B21|nr:hypothetical protein [Pseudodesulfovibrio thermohalotolerans]WFS60997.1 hypothetical protein LF599_09920 [Pseudodesulfovibrio thermohalotolerans]